ncbi:hypothetical protein HO173_003687 [Letharia columbiana]|uniref:Uncharacterized protein n=1 Tax=Letharia columbiana TaxID=112416 RepID=A0A8H6G065_9LECA|nr:uncharacterized protein HO173_003687 [Letharia columbiana]KAF6238053.1 hypothetical protein HO173_003687 [Letharia columbiana]
MQELPYVYRKNIRHAGVTTSSEVKQARYWITERFNTDEEPPHRSDQEGYRSTEREWRASRIAELEKWKRPEQLPITAETVFLGWFRSKKPNCYFRKTREPGTIDDAWNGLSLKKREHYLAKAKKNEIYNTAKLAKFNKHCPLSPSVVDLSLTWASLSEREIQDWLLIGPRHAALQKWKRYRFDHPRACGGRETPVPETPFRIMDLPFELRRGIFSLVLSQSYPVLQFPSDGSADTLTGPVDVRLFAASRQVFAEAVRIFYEENTFSIDTKPSRYYKDIPLFVRQSTGNEVPRPTDLMKRVNVNVTLTLTDRTETDDFLFLWKKFCEFLRTCRNLRKVVVTARRAQSFQEAIDRATDRKIDKLIEMLMNIRSPHEAVFSDITISEGSVQEPSCWRKRRITGIIFRSGSGKGAAMAATETQWSTA